MKRFFKSDLGKFVIIAGLMIAWFVFTVPTAVLLSFRGVLAYGLCLLLIFLCMCVGNDGDDNE